MVGNLGQPGKMGRKTRADEIRARETGWRKKEASDKRCPECRDVESSCSTKGRVCCSIIAGSYPRLHRRIRVTITVDTTE